MLTEIMRVGLLWFALGAPAQETSPAASRPAADVQTGSKDRAAAWLARQKESVSAQEYELLSRAQATLLANVARPEDVPPSATCGGRESSEAGKPLPWHPLRGIYPSPFKYRGVWSWDGPFHAMAVARWDPELAREQFDITLKHQQESGLLPDVVMEDGNVVTDFGKPPVMPWACMRVDQLAPDLRYLASVYPKFVTYERHWMTNRGGKEEGLFHYGGGIPPFEAGWDTSVRWDKGCDNLWAVDLNCCMVMLYESMAYMAGRLDKKDEQAAWKKRAGELGKRINETLWNEEAGAYMDRNRASKEFSGVLSPASFMPLYVRVATEERAERMARLAADPKKFFPGMPSVSYDNPEYRSGDYWRGPTWVNVAYFAIRGLKNYGHDRVADEYRKTLLEWCAKNTDYLWEYYDSKSGKGLGAPQYGWTGTFVIEFILNWDEKVRK